MKNLKIQLVLVMSVIITTLSYGQTKMEVSTDMEFNPIVQKKVLKLDDNSSDPKLAPIQKNGETLANFLIERRIQDPNDLEKDDKNFVFFSAPLKKFIKISLTKCQNGQILKN